MKRIKEITDEFEMKWKHVPTKMNRADVGSRGASYRQLEKMRPWNGPYWPVNQSSWPDQESQHHENDEEIKKLKIKGAAACHLYNENCSRYAIGKSHVKESEESRIMLFKIFHNSKSQMLRIQ